MRSQLKDERGKDFPPLEPKASVLPMSYTDLTFSSLVQQILKYCKKIPSNSKLIRNFFLMDQKHADKNKRKEIFFD